MAFLGTFTQQPSEILDYDLDFREWIPSGDTIVSVAATSDAGITLGSTIIDPTTLKIVKQWVSGGVTGTVYKIEVTATTAGGRVKQVEFKIRVREY